MAPKPPKPKEEEEFELKLHTISQHLEEVNDHEGHSRTVYCVSFSPDGQLVVTGSADKTAKLWSYHTRVRARLAPNPRPRTCCQQTQSNRCDCCAARAVHLPWP